MANNMFNKEVYMERRKQLRSRTQTGLILLLANEQSSMSYKDNWYPFRQDSTFLYFTGLDLPSLALTIDAEGDATLYGDDLTMDEIIWMGDQPSLKDLAALAGIANVKASGSLSKDLQSATASKQQVHYLPPYRFEHIDKLSNLLGTPISNIETGASTHLVEAVVSLRSIKSDIEVAEIKKAVRTTEEMHLFAIKNARAGMTEAALAGSLQAISIANGGNLSFPTILTTRGEILHNHYSNKPITSGSLLLVDAGAETAMHYAGDLTRTFPVDASFTTLQREVYEIVLASNLAAAAALKPGTKYLDVHLLAAEKLVEGLTQLGLMKGDVKEAVAAGAHTLFFQCGLGHMMGLDVHDMENLGEQYVGYTPHMKKSTAFGLKSLRLGRSLEAGFVLTVEPGLYFIPQLMDRWAAEQKHAPFINYNALDKFRNFGGVRIEDDYLITPGGSELLSTSLPRTADEIEVIRAASFS
jgi:Xaa-Pro aminopeptidase